MVCDCCPSLTTTLFIGAAAYFLYKKVFPTVPKIAPKPDVLKKDYKKDVVYLYQFPRLRKCPNVSPFCLKVETILRAFKIEHEIIDNPRNRSRNGTLPFIELNGEHIADSDLIELKLRKHFNIPSLPAEQEAQAVAIARLVENHLFFLLIHYKIQIDEFFTIILSIWPVPDFLKPLLTPIIKAQLTNNMTRKTKNAIGDFEEKEFDELLHRDLKAVQDSIKGKFLFGDEITIADAIVFSQLASDCYVANTHVTDVLSKDFPAVLEYVERVKQEVYPTDFSL